VSRENEPPVKAGGSRFTCDLRKQHPGMTGTRNSVSMRKLVVLVGLLAMLAIGTTSTAAAVPGFPNVPGAWSHIDINRKIGGKWHTLSLDRGRITQVNATQLTLREADGTSPQIPLTSAAIVRIYSFPGSIYQLRRGMVAMTMRIDGGPAVRIKVGR
jgi:hypothetical protein